MNWLHGVSFVTGIIFLRSYQVGNVEKQYIEKKTEYKAYAKSFEHDRKEVERVRRWLLLPHGKAIVTEPWEMRVGCMNKH